MTGEFQSKNIMISDFGGKKIPNSRMARFIRSEYDGKKLFRLVNASRRVLIFIDNRFLKLFINFQTYDCKFCKCFS